MDERALFARWTHTGTFVTAHTIGTSTYRRGQNRNQGGMAIAEGAFVDNLDQSVVLVGYVLCELLLLNSPPPTRVALWSTPAGPVSTPAHVSLHVRKQFVQIRRWRP